MFWLPFQQPFRFAPDGDVMSVIYDRDPCGLEVRPPEEGLEVWAPEVGGLEFSTRVQIEQVSEVFRGCDDLETVDLRANGFVKINAESFNEKPKQNLSDEQSTKKQWLILVLSGITLLFIIVATVLGIVLGLRLNNTKTPTETPQASATPPATSSKPANAAYATSGIGVTGWWTGPSSFTIRLVYQGQDGYLRLMRYHSGDGNWSTLATFSDANAKLGSPIAASSYNIPFYCFSPITSSNVRGTPLLSLVNCTTMCAQLTQSEPERLNHTLFQNFTQVEIFYLNNENILQEWYFREQDSPPPPHKPFPAAGSCPPTDGKQVPTRASQHTGPASSSKAKTTVYRKPTTPISLGRGMQRASRAAMARLWQSCLLLSPRGDSEVIRFSISGMTRSSFSRGELT